MNLTTKNLKRFFKGFLYAFTALFSGVILAVTEEPKYSVLLKEDAFELRQYAPQLVAETVVNGDMDAASSQGFRAIADFIFERLIDIRKQSGLTILLVEQRVAEALESADHGYVLEAGRVVLEGNNQSLRADDRVRQAYLGM